MAKSDRRLYGLAVYLSVWLDGAELRDAVEDYAEYLDNQGENCYRESPEEFGRDLRQNRLRRRPACRAMGAVGAAVVLVAAMVLFDRAGTMSQKIWAMTAVAAGLPAAMWALLGGSAASAFSPADDARRVLATALGSVLAAILALRYWLLLTDGQLLAGLPAYMIGAAANLTMTLGQALALAAFVLAVMRSIRRSAYYVCLQAQALALWTLFRGAHYILRDMSLTDSRAMPSLLPFAAGWLTSLALWYVLRRLTGKEAAHGRTDEEGRP